MILGAVHVVPLVEVTSFTWLLVSPLNDDAPAAQPALFWSSAHAMARCPVVGSMASDEPWSNGCALSLTVIGSDQVTPWSCETDSTIWDEMYPPCPKLDLKRVQ